MGAWAGGMMVIMALVWLAIPALIAWAVWAVSRFRHESRPLDLLKETYAKGQITHDQFEQMKKDLT
jgi:putative membrane protein